MRSPVRKHLVATFQREFERRYPEFSLLTLPRGTAFKIWKWGVAPHLIFFVTLSPFRAEDKFALEIAWSEDGEFPWLGFGQFDAAAMSWRERLGRLWKRGGDEPLWDAAPEVAAATQAYFDALQRGEHLGDTPPPPIDVVLARIAPLVDDCLQKFREYAVPVFNQVAQHRGLGKVLKQNDA